MSLKIQQLALALLQEIRNHEVIDPEVKDGLAGLLEEKAEQKMPPATSAPPASKAETERLAKQMNLKAQYVKRLNTLRHFGFIGETAEFSEAGVATPSYQTVESSFRPEQLKLALDFKVPTLLLIPETSLGLKIRAMDAIKQKVLRHGTYINEAYTKTEDLSNKITGWRAAIVDGAREMEMLSGDDLNAPFKERIKLRQSARKPFENGVDRHKYCLLMMETVKTDNSIDQKLFTLLEDDPVLSDSKIPAADYDPVNGWVRFNWRDPDDVNVCARFRPSVGGETLL